MALHNPTSKVSDIQGAGGGCFGAGTLIATPNGMVKIEDIKVGDPVWSFDESGSIRHDMVSEIFHHEPMDILYVQFWGGEFYITGNHWVLDEHNSFERMDNMQVEQTLVDHRGRLRPIKSIQALEPQPVYNLTVAKNHTFIANDIRVHNGGGGKKSSKARVAVESPNTLRSVATARVLDLLCEGPILGLANGAQSIFLDDTPLENADGESNFSGFVWDIRHGDPDQEPMPGFDDVETEQIVETEITRQLGPIVRRVSNNDIDAVRLRIRIPQLAAQNKTNGDLGPSSVELKIEVKPSDGNYRPVDFAYDEADRTGTTTTAAGAIGFRAVVKKRALVKLNSVASEMIELRYRPVGAGGWISLGARQVSKVIKTVANQSAPDGYIDGQPAYYHTFTSSYDVMGIGSNTYEISIVQGDEITDFKSYQRANLLIEGKNTSPTEKSYRFSLPGVGPWDVRVSRVTPDSEDSALQNSTIWASYTEIVEDKFIYPDSAYIGVAVNSELFGSSIPKRSYDIYGREILVPSNYDAITKTYSGIWDGTFSVAWSDNPAWCFLDVLTNERFGLGNILSVDMVDTAKLYTIAQYCDELVPDGFGGLEPRFTLNCCINTRQEAYQLLNLMVSVFRGMLFWSSGSVSFGHDAPRDVDVFVTRANVIEGEFTYSTSADRAQFNSILVTWNDPNDQDRTNIEVVEDNKDIAKRGLRQTDVYAFGCKSRGQANRYGKWMLYTGQKEQETVTYHASLDHLSVVPGMIAGIIDPNVAGAELAGRLANVNGTDIKLDRKVELTYGKNYILGVTDATGKIQYRDVLTLGGVSTDSLSLNAPFNPQPPKGNIWAIKNADIEPRQFRIVSLIESEDYMFEVSGVEYNPSKHDFVDRDFALEPVKFTLLSSGDVAKPTNLSIVESLFKTNNQIRTRTSLSWTASKDSRVFMYNVSWRKLPGGIVESKETGEEVVDIFDLEPGLYEFFVSGVTGFGSSVAAKLSNYTILGKTAPPGDVENFVAERKVNGVILSWSEVEDLDILGYQIRRGQSWDTAEYVADITGTSLFVSLDTADDTTFLIRARDDSRVFSTNVTSVNSSVTAPDTPTAFTATAQADMVLFRWERVAGTDNSYEIRRGQSWALAEKIAESSTDELLILDPQRDDAVYWIKSKSTAGLYSSVPRAASAQRALIPDRNVIIEYDNQNDGGAGLYPGVSYDMVAGPDDSLVLSEISAGIYQPRGEHYFTYDLGSTFRARNWLETSIVNIAGGGPTWDEFDKTWDSPEAQVSWLPLQDLDGAALQKVISLARSPLEEELYAWSFFNTTNDFRSVGAVETDHVTYSMAKYQNGLKITDMTKVSYNISLNYTFSLVFHLRVDEILKDKRTFLVLKKNGQASRLEIGYDAALGAHGSIYAVDNHGAMLYLEIPQAITGLNFLTIGIAQGAAKRVLYYRSEREYLTVSEEAPLDPLEYTFDRLYLYNKT